MNNYELTQERNNLQEHLRIINENLQIANGELSDVLSEKQIIFAELESARGEIVAAKKIAKEILIKAQYSAEQKQEKATKNLNESTIILQNASHEADSIVRDAKLEKEELIKSITKLNTQYQQLMADNNDLFEENSKSLSKKIALLHDIDAITSDLNEIRKKIGEATSQKDNLTNEIDKMMSEYESQIATLRKEVIKETLRAQIPAALLDAREKDLKLKEKNLSILKRRFEGTFGKVFPGQKVII